MFLFRKNGDDLQPSHGANAVAFNWPATGLSWSTIAVSFSGCVICIFFGSPSFSVSENRTRFNGRCTSCTLTGLKWRYWSGGGLWWLCTLSMICFVVVVVDDGDDGDLGHWFLTKLTRKPELDSPFPTRLNFGCFCVCGCYAVLFALNHWLLVANVFNNYS